MYKIVCDISVIHCTSIYRLAWCGCKKLPWMKMSWWMQKTLRITGREFLMKKSMYERKKNLHSALVQETRSRIMKVRVRNGFLKQKEWSVECKSWLKDKFNQGTLLKKQHVHSCASYWKCATHCQWLDSDGTQWVKTTP